MAPSVSPILAFEVAAGTVAGGDHVAAGRGGQDGFCWASSTEMIAAVACDGCGSARCSEVGARIGARLLVAALVRHGPRLVLAPSQELLDAAYGDVMAELERLADAMGASREAIVADYLLFTAVGAVVTWSSAFVFLAGDGLFAVNGQVEVVESRDNAPSYMGYGLLGRPEPPRIVAELSSIMLDSLMVGTDGLQPLVAAGGGTPRAAELWSDDRLFANPRALERRLRLWNRGRTTVDWNARAIHKEAPLFHDDATAVVLRRRPDAEDRRRR